jgi:hypothetical protein
VTRSDTTAWPEATLVAMTAGWRPGPRSFRHPGVTMGKVLLIRTRTACLRFNRPVVIETPHASSSPE